MSGKSEQYLVAYQEHSRVLRTWLVAYGIGGPVLFATEESIATTVKASGDVGCIAVCFLSGVALQLVLTILHKVTMWKLYHAEENERTKRGWRYDWAYAFSERFEVDIVVDVATVLLFGIATWKTFQSLAS